MQHFSLDCEPSSDDVRRRKELPVERLLDGATRVVAGSAPRDKARMCLPDYTAPIDMKLAGNEHQDSTEVTFDGGNGGFRHNMSKEKLDSAIEQLKREVGKIPDWVVRDQDWQIRCWHFLSGVRVSCAEFKLQTGAKPKIILNASIRDGYMCGMQVEPKERQVHARCW